MKFMSVKCVVCDQYFFDADEVVAYQVRGRKAESVELAGQEPWSGVRCVCKGCCEFLGRLVRP